ncbi:hypothetical protein B0H21DRAFT_710331 [Amylocystis lapponica]|nr:hypothetical protein B0H21DRAFT_710331 [Amylocystis lapponica]
MPNTNIDYTPLHYSHSRDAANAIAAETKMPEQNNLPGPGVSGTWTPEDVWKHGLHQVVPIVARTCRHLLVRGDRKPVLDNQRSGPPSLLAVESRRRAFLRAKRAIVAINRRRGHVKFVGTRIELACLEVIHVQCETLHRITVWLRFARSHLDTEKCEGVSTAEGLYSRSSRRRLEEDSDHTGISSCQFLDAVDSGEAVAVAAAATIRGHITRRSSELNIVRDINREVTVIYWARTSMGTPRLSAPGDARSPRHTARASCLGSKMVTVGSLAPVEWLKGATRASERRPWMAYPVQQSLSPFIRSMIYASFSSVADGGDRVEYEPDGPLVKSRLIHRQCCGQAVNNMSEEIVLLSALFTRDGANSAIRAERIGGGGVTIEVWPVANLDAEKVVAEDSFAVVGKSEAMVGGIAQGHADISCCVDEGRNVVQELRPERTRGRIRL